MHTQTEREIEIYIYRRGFGWDTPLDHLSNVAFDIAHIRRKIKTLPLPGKLSDQFNWPFFIWNTHKMHMCPLSLCLSVSLLPSLSLSEV